MFCWPNTWTYITEEVPEAEGWYIIALKDGTVAPAYCEICNGQEINWVRFNNNNVVAWTYYPVNPLI